MITEDTWRLRQRLLLNYGGRCTCACGCQEAMLALLQLHHIHGDGADERKKTRGVHYYTRLLNLPINPRLQLLCVSCHWLETMFGACARGVSANNGALLTTATTGSHEEPRHNGTSPSAIAVIHDAWAEQWPDDPEPSVAPTPVPPPPRRRWFQRS